MKNNLRSWTVITLAVIMAMAMTFTLAGCGQSGQEQPEEPAQEEEPAVGMPNPWSDVATAEEAAEGAGVETFECAGIETSLGTTEPEVYRWMKGLAEAQFPIAAVDMTIRKGTDALTDVAEGDISGDYNEYKYTWTQDVDGTEVTCSGNRKGESTKTLWSKNGYYYSISAFGAGGDDDFGLSEDDVKALVSGVK
ncbi:MAG: hypothetical protein IJH41_00305 [Eubacterium sp.]|nr:hypothetical protein [Eubacterium sp.]